MSKTILKTTKILFLLIGIIPCLHAKSTVDKTTQLALKDGLYLSFEEFVSNIPSISINSNQLEINRQAYRIGFDYYVDDL